MGAIRNVTLSLDEEILHEARVLAAQEGLSVSALLRRELANLVEQQRGYAKAKDSALRRLKRGQSLDEPGAIPGTTASSDFSKVTVGACRLSLSRNCHEIHLQTRHWVAFYTVDQFQGLASLYPVLNHLNRRLVSSVWFAAKALLLNERALLQAKVPLLDAAFDRRAGDERSLALAGPTPQIAAYPPSG